MKKILFLGYNRKKTNLIEYINNYDKNFHVTHLNKIISLKELRKFDNVICFGYRHKIDKEIIKNYKNKIINLHIGYLPFNKGSHPNLWAFLENTPSGVTIHEVNKDIDTGKIIKQKIIDFDLIKNKNNLTFSKTYNILRKEVESLFIENIKSILNYEYQSFDQIGKGSFHKKEDLPKILNKWDQKIYTVVQKYNKEQKKLMIEKLQILNEIEATRKNNNINWMNMVRTALKNSPKNTLDILKDINNDDKKISILFKKIVK